MVEEYISIMTNDVWEVVPRLEDRSVVGSRWIDKIKYVIDRSVEKYKARFLAKGYAQKEGIDGTLGSNEAYPEMQIGQAVQWTGKVPSGIASSVGSGMVSWSSRKQKSVALSSVEAEYMATNIATCEAIWLRKLLVSLFRQRMEATGICCDNQSCIKLLENPVFHDMLNHIDIRCHFIKDCVQHGAVWLQYVPIGERAAYILTKL
eukprot:PITA_10258